MTAPQVPSAPADPLALAGQALAALETVPLDRHPQVFTRFDELLREALDSPSQVGSG
jgi:hypothetical protein